MGARCGNLREFPNEEFKRRDGVKFLNKIYAYERWRVKITLGKFRKMENWKKTVCFFAFFFKFFFEPFCARDK